MIKFNTEIKIVKRNEKKFVNKLIFKTCYTGYDSHLIDFQQHIKAVKNLLRHHYGTS